MDNNIYSKLEREEAFSAKRNILSTQMDLLHTLQNIEEYKNLRKKELILKIKAKNTIKEVKELISKLHKSVPEKIHKQMNHDLRSEIKEVKEKKSSKKVSGEEEVKKSKGLSIEQELLNIQHQLSELSNKR